MTSPTRALAAAGQSIWLDDLHRRLIDSGELARLIERDGLAGITSNPAILSQALRDRDEYRAPVAAARARGEPASSIYETLAIADVQAAADVLRPVYERTGGEDGYVSLEVSPRLADDVAATVADAMSLWQRLARPNVMIKVPATVAGLEAIPRLVAAGLNLNVTLLFDPVRHVAVADAYLRGLESRLADGEPLGGIASVASFFVSRIDTAVDAALDRVADRGGRDAGIARSLRGRVAFACAARAYDQQRRQLADTRWSRLAAAGARPQRLLWASTSTKDPQYRDVRYVEDLIVPGTVNTLPPATLAAFREHGVVGAAFEAHRSGAEGTLAALAALGVDLAAILARLERDGVRKFVEPFEALERWIEHGGIGGAPPIAAKRA